MSELHVRSRPTLLAHESVLFVCVFNHSLRQMYNTYCPALLSAFIINHNSLSCEQQIGLCVQVAVSGERVRVYTWSAHVCILGVGVCFFGKIEALCLDCTLPCVSRRRSINCMCFLNTHVVIVLALKSFTCMWRMSVVVPFAENIIYTYTYTHIHVSQVALHVHWCT